MIDFEKLYRAVTEHFSGNQKKLDVESPLGVYYGVTPEGYLRLAFRSTIQSTKVESTKLLKVTQGEESRDVYWTCFDLLSNDAKSAFFAFCQNLVEAICEVRDEVAALSKLRKRYISWKALFKKSITHSVPKELIQGLFGELYFLNNYMIEKYGGIASVLAWGGPDKTSKDFAINSEWYEVKTIGVTSPCVKISSLAQLSSHDPGKLIIIRAEQMPLEYSNGLSSISELMSCILAKLTDETAEGIFIDKVSAYVIDSSDEAFAIKFDVKSEGHYNVVSGFPRITIDDVPYPEISNVSYEIAVGAIDRFLEE